MKLLDRLVLLDLIPMFFSGVAIGSSVLIVGGPVLTATQYISQGVPWPIVMRIVALSFPPYLVLTFPMAVLLATLLGFGRISADSEGTAISAGGVPFWRIAMPAVYLGLFATGVGYYINDRVAAAATLKIEEIKEEVVNQGSETTLPFDFPYRPNGNLVFLVHVEKGFDIQEKKLKDVTITYFDEAGRPASLIYADYAQWEGGKNWRLLNASVYELGVYPGYQTLGDTRTEDLETDPASLAFLKRDPDTLSFSELRMQIAELKVGGKGDDGIIRKAEVKLWTKVSLPFASLVFAVVGSPIGLRRQRTAKGGWSLAIIIIFGYYVIFTVMSSIASAGHCSPELAAFLPNILGLIVGVMLWWRSSL